MGGVLFAIPKVSCRDPPRRCGSRTTSVHTRAFKDRIRWTHVSIRWPKASKPRFWGPYLLDARVDSMA